MNRILRITWLALTLLSASWSAAQEAEKAEATGTAAPATAAPAAAAATPTPTKAVVGPDGKPIMQMPGGDQPGKATAQPAAQPGQQPMAGKEPSASPMPVTRPMAPPQPADASELHVQPDEQGLVQFSFQGQPWPDVLEWLARSSNRTLDWQELPGDYLNLTVRRKYSLEEARDLINRHLLARGYTLLEHGEGFSVTKTDKLNPAMVPRVDAEELDEQLPHSFVKTLFELDWLLAEDVVKEFEALKSPNGKLTALPATNRIEAMDAATNLQEMYRVLEEEQSGKGRNRLVREFVLQHVKAAQLQQQLEAFLGLESKRRETPAAMNPQQMAMMQQQMQMQAQMQAQQAQAGNPAAAGGREKKEVRLVADERRNTLIAHAPPDRMAMIESFVELVDVPTGAAESLDAYMNRMRVHRLASLDAEQFVTSLQEMNVLAPSTKLQPDKRNNAVIVDAGLADHFIIKSIIERLDGSGRRFEVIPLRRHAADEVAGSIEFLMGGNEPQEDTSRRNRYYDYGFYAFGMGGRQDEQQGNRDRFRVGANLEYNQLLLWANDIELEEVEKLLIKLGEIPSRDGGGRVRTVEIPYGAETEEFLKQLQRAWPSIAPNPLVVPDASPAPPPTKKPAPKAPESSTERMPEAEASAPDRPTELKLDSLAPSSHPYFTQAFRLAAADDVLAPSESSLPNAGGKPPVEEFPQAGGPSAVAPPPVTITVGPDGNLVIASDDPRALNLLEQWMAEIVPPPRSFEVFHLENAPALWVKYNLEDFFEEEKEDRRGELESWWYGGPPPARREDGKRQLGKRRPVRFIDDPDTNTIVVQGADREQLRVIAELIKLYDVPEPVNAQNARVTKLFHVKYSKATVIAETIKDAYRDLLSSNDKALQNQQQQQNNRPEATIIRNYGPQLGGNEGDQDREKRTQMTFKGKLSIGIDEVTNTLLVSAEGDSLLNLIGDMIEQLDQAAQPEERVRVVQLGGDIDPQRLTETLRRMLGSDKPGAQPPAPAATPAPTPPPAQAPLIVE